MTTQTWGFAGAKGVLARTISGSSNLLPGVINGAQSFVRVNIQSFLGGSALALNSDGTVWWWGDNSNDISGTIGDSSAHSTPATVGGLSGTFTQVAGAGDTFYALRDDGNLYAWGNNGQGQSGLGDYVAHLTPALSATGVVLIIAGNSSALILKSGGVVQTCGNNDRGQCATGTAGFPGPNTWQTVTPASGTVISAACFDDGFYVLRADGSVLGAGGSANGNLGLIQTSNPTWTTVPISNVTHVWGGAFAGFFRLNDDTIWSIGSNQLGQLGVGSTQASLANSTTALQITGLPTGVTLERVNDKSGTTASVIALGSDKKVYTWGAGGSGQMGNNTTTAENDSPLQNAAIAAAAWIGGGSGSMVAGTVTAGARTWAAVIG